LLAGSEWANIIIGQIGDEILVRFVRRLRIVGIISRPVPITLLSTVIPLLIHLDKISRLGILMTKVLVNDLS